MSVESKAVKAATITTAFLAASGIGLMIREREQRRAQRDAEFNKAKRLAEESNNSGDSGVIFTRRNY